MQVLFYNIIKNPELSRQTEGGAQAKMDFYVNILGGYVRRRHTARPWEDRLYASFCLYSNGVETSGGTFEKGRDVHKT